MLVDSQRVLTAAAAIVGLDFVALQFIAFSKVAPKATQWPIFAKRIESLAERLQARQGHGPNRLLL